MGLIYFGIRVTDLGRSLDFYIHGLGLEELRRGRLPHGGRRVLLADPGTSQRLELNWYPTGSPYAVPYVAGEGLDHLGYSTGHAAAVARRLVEHGGRVVLTPTDPLGVRQNFYVEDPDGNWIELMGWGSRRSPRPGKPAAHERSTASPRTRSSRLAQGRVR
jgi:catechol 2,3-dioxygenase-like lactoylglutathione lyase family enzyme